MNWIFKCYILAFLISTNVTTTIYAQSIKKIEKETDKAIIWTTDKKLKFSDFQAKIDSTSSKKALTGANIVIVPYAYKNGVYEYRVLAKFHKDLSWINTTNVLVIHHEQLHFDIAELFARKMRREIQAKKRTNGLVLESDYRSIHKRVFRSYINYQMRYDSQTGHSTNQEEQQRWHAIVVEELQKLEDYNINL
ncbi:DUF922 domain-containing protein [Formosa sp. L2A11]|uniref:DUF922 domain-containing protein n=1 Tax=Formosa sp. L2A11 TaxID=2686363 RepID=UPI00131B2186|nr:DUF922 domain-containing protein [Formosa sp. L2A11]